MDETRFAKVQACTHTTRKPPGYTTPNWYSPSCRAGKSFPPRQANEPAQFDGVVKRPQTLGERARDRGGGSCEFTAH